MRWKMIGVVGLCILCCSACKSQNEVQEDFSQEQDIVDIEVSEATLAKTSEEVSVEHSEKVTEAPMEDEYQVSYPILVEENRELTLTLHGRKRSEDYEQYGINRIVVTEGDKVLQEIYTKEAIDTQWEDDQYFDAYTEGYEPDGGLTTIDMNFDGSGDMGLQGWITSGANIPYYYWLWNSKTEQFEYAFCLCNAEPDAHTQQISTYLREGAGCYYTTFYAYDETGALQKVKEIIETYDEEGNVDTQMNEY